MGLWGWLTGETNEKKFMSKIVVNWINQNVINLRDLKRTKKQAYVRFLDESKKYDLVWRAFVNVKNELRYQIEEIYIKDEQAELLRHLSLLEISFIGFYVKELIQFIELLPGITILGNSSSLHRKFISDILIPRMVGSGISDTELKTYAKDGRQYRLEVIHYFQNFANDEKHKDKTMHKLVGKLKQL